MNRLRSKGQRELFDILRDIAYEAGADRVETIAMSKHAAMDITIHGKKFRQTLPNGNNTERGRKNSIAQLRQSIRALTIQSEPRSIYVIGG